MPNISQKLIYGKGSKGNAVAKVNGKVTKAYSTWGSMLKRCYCQKYLSRNPTYIGCTVCEEWLFFPTFEKWFNENYVEGWQLDKDLLVSGNKVYSPHSCVFAPPAINTLFTDCGKSRGEYPLGVSIHKRPGKFRADLTIDGIRKYLGLFDTADEGHRAYLVAKKANVLRMATEWKEKISDKLYIALIKKAGD